MNTHKLHAVTIRIAGAVLLFVLPVLCSAWTPVCKGVQLLEPVGLEGLGGESCVTVGPGLTTLFNYINQIFPWAIGVCAGLTVVWGVWSGSSMIMNAGDESSFKKEKDHFIAALVGLLAIIFSGAFLSMINANFFHAT